MWNSNMYNYMISHIVCYSVDTAKWEYTRAYSSSAVLFWNLDPVVVELACRTGLASLSDSMLLCVEIEAGSTVSVWLLHVPLVTAHHRIRAPNLGTEVGSGKSFSCLDVPQIIIWIAGRYFTWSPTEFFHWNIQLPPEQTAQPAWQHVCFQQPFFQQTIRNNFSSKLFLHSRKFSAIFSWNFGPKIPFICNHLCSNLL